MKQSPLIIGLGAVTAVGLTAPQTCAAIRAGISGFRDAVWGDPLEEPQIGAVVPARSALKFPSICWLTNLATRAIQECLEYRESDTKDTALLLAIPESFREHPALVGFSEQSLLATIEKKLKRKFHPASAVLREGHATALRAIVTARDLLSKNTARYCIVGGVDSLINENDYRRLKKANRLQGSENSQGLVPGEGAAFILITLPNKSLKSRPFAQILGVGSAIEEDSVLGERYSVGNGLRNALAKAIAEAAIPEENIGFLISDMNGERYRAWESAICHARFYRTRRERLNTWYPAASVGDIGAASGALLVVVGAMAIARGYTPGQIAMCEGASEEGVRAACLIGQPLLN